MQLSQLLKRLSMVERTQLVKRLGAPADVAKNPQSLTAYVSNRYRLAAVFLNLDSAELALLQWVAGQPGHEAPWSSLMAEIDGRAPVDQVMRSLQELRLWGLADHKASPRDGFLGTYPAVAAALLKQHVGLPEHLEARSAEDLRKVCTSLGVHHPPLSKAACAQLIGEMLSRHGTLAKVLLDLTEETRGLLEWVRAGGGRVPVDLMARIHPGVAVGTLIEMRYLYHQTKARALHDLLWRCLLVPVTDQYSWSVSAFAVPLEVERALTDRPFFDEHPLLPPLLEPADAQPTWVPQPMHLLRDVAHLAGFITAGRCEWKQDGQPYQRSLKAFGKAVQDQDPNYPTLLWDLCELAGLVVPASRAQASPPVDMSTLGPPGLFRLLVDGWAGTSEGATYYTRPVALARGCLLQVLATLPADTWITRDSVHAYLHFARPRLFDAPDPAHPAQTQQLDWPTIGRLFAAQGATPDGRPAVMVPAGIQNLLADRAADESDLLPPWEEYWRVQPDRTVVAPPNLHPQGIMELWQVAQLEENQGAAIFRITPATVAAALNRNLEPARIREILEEGSKSPLPDTVVRLLGDQFARYGQITLGPAQAYLRTSEPAILDELLHDRQLTGMVIRRLAPDLACIENYGPVGARDALRRAGYLPVVGVPAKPGQNGHAPAQPAAPAGRVDPRVTRFMKGRVDDGLLIWVKWEEGGRDQTAVVEVVDIDREKVQATLQSDGQDIRIWLASIREARVVDGQDVEDYEEEAEEAEA